MELVVQPLGRTLHVEPGTNLLTALREHQVPISYSCTAGRCGTCRCKVVSGDVYETGRDSKLTHPDEAGYVLACMSILTSNCVIEVPEPDEVVTHPARIVKATVLAIEAVTHDIRRLVLKPAKPLAFSASFSMRSSRFASSTVSTRRSRTSAAMARRTRIRSSRTTPRRPRAS